MKINGNLVFNSDATGEIQHAYIERLALAPAFNASEKGRIYFNTTTALYYYNDGTAWQPFATGGNASQTQQYLNNLLTSVGSSVTGTGTWNGPSAFTGDAILASATSITNALSLLSAASSGHDSLAELADVDLGSLVDGQVLRYNSTSGKWEEHTLVLADITDVTATAAEVNVLDGITATTAELNFTSGVTSAIQTQLNNKQALNANLTNISSLSGTGLVTQIGANTFVDRSLVAPAAGITITDNDGVAGNPTFALADDLAALEGLATTGFIVRAADGVATTRALATGSVNRITINNGDGVASAPTIDLATVTDSGTGTFKKIATDGYGRVTGTEAVVAGDITALVGSIYVDAAGDTVTGNLVFSGGATVTGLPTPTVGADAANKNYVDAAVAGLSWKQAVTVLADANVDTTSAPASIDGQTLVAGNRVLLTAQTSAAQNGIYVFSAESAALVRATDADTYEELNGAAVFVELGGVYADTGWTQNGDLTGFTGQAWVQFTGSGTYTAGAGLSLAGNTFNVNLGAGIAQLPSDEVGLDLYSPSALILTVDGTTHSTDTASRLHLLLKAAGGLSQDVNGLGIPASGVTNTMLANSAVTIDADGTGTGVLNLGDTLNVFGSVVQGITTAVADGTGTITISAEDASYSQKGVARFASASFDVTAGAVSIKAAGVSNAQLVNDAITYVADDANTAVVALGNVLNIIGDSAQGIATSIAGATVTIGAVDATSTQKGVAKFAAADFAVTSGNVTLVAKALNSLTDVTVATPTSGQALVYSNADSKFVNESFYYLYTAGSASTSHTVTHNLGQKFCNVTVVDSTDEVVIPQSITFDTANQLTVTFTSAISCKVVVMGVKLQ